MDEFYDSEIWEGLGKKIKSTFCSDKEITLMEVCGTHTMSIARNGIKELLPENVRPPSEPSCPVCVTPNKVIDLAVGYARVPDVCLATFGDMMKVPGSYSSLEKERVSGFDVRVVYSVLDALKIAKENPQKKVIFLGIGFETTAPTVAASLVDAKNLGLKNYFVLCAHKLIPPAIKAIIESGEVKVDGFLLPGHVSTIIGRKAYEFIAEEYGIPCVVAGFEPVDILQGILSLVQQITDGVPRVENCYKRSVSEEGNLSAKKMLSEVFDVCNSEWRSLGVIPCSGFKISGAYREFDAIENIEVEVGEPKEDPCCLCGAILRGVSSLLDCPLFGKVCSPESPFGPCMVSSEGTCAAYYKYERKKISLAHGSGGKLTHELIKNLFLPKFLNPVLSELTDAAIIELNGVRFAFTTDSYVVHPVFFPGGNIGKLAVCGTINDLAVMGAKPMFISCSCVISENFDLGVLEEITELIAEVAKTTGVTIVTGDTKVVDQRKRDDIFITTSGLGICTYPLPRKIEVGDKVIINGCIGEHELAVLSSRGELGLELEIKSDCAPLWELISMVLEVSPNVKFMRDPTRGGVATTLNEIVEGKDFGIVIDEAEVPVSDEVKGACALLGFDPLYLPNEGKAVIVVSPEDANKVVEVMSGHPLGRDAKIIGEVVTSPTGMVCLKTKVGGKRVLDMPLGTQLPRIC